MKFDRTNVYVSTVAGDARDTALECGLGLEIAEFCTAANMDSDFPLWDKRAREKTEGIERRMLHAPFNELCPAAIEPRVYEVARARYREAAALAARYGVNRMVVHSGYVPLVYFKEYFHERSVIFWRELLSDLPGDFTLLLENVLENEPGLLAGIAKELNDSRFRLCLDIGHASTIVSDVPVTEWIDVAAPYLGHVHIHNNYRQYDNHNPVGDGLINMREALELLLIKKPERMTLTIESILAAPSAKWLENEGFI